MDVTVLGTGSADGWPNPFCSCASCGTSRSAGSFRGQTAALVDGRLLLDCGPHTPDAAHRAGADLTGLRHVLITHPHPDHCAPAFLLFRSWATQGPLDVVGPASVVEAARHWVAPDSQVRFTVTGPGDRLRLGEYDVRVLAARHGPPGEAVLYDVGTTGARLLYATDTGPLPDETVRDTRDAAYDLVLMEETFGDFTTHDTEHLDLVTFPQQLRRLTRVGAVTPDTDVVAVHLSHHNPPAAELARRLAAWGARLVEDGSRISVGPAAPPHGRPSRSRAHRTLVLGGARSGKSREAERLLAAEQTVTYVATGYPVPDDPRGRECVGEEWADRVRRHRADRPAHWRTCETLGLVGLLEQPGEPLLVDCLTLWLTRVMDRHQAWDDQTWEAGAEQAVTAEIEALVGAWRATPRRVVAVSNEVGQGVVPVAGSARRFRDTMGRLNAAIAAHTEDVRWCLAGRVVPVAGGGRPDG